MKQHFTTCHIQNHKPLGGMGMAMDKLPVHFPLPLQRDAIEASISICDIWIGGESSAYSLHSILEPVPGFRKMITSTSLYKIPRIDCVHRFMTSTPIPCFQLSFQCKDTLYVESFNNACLQYLDKRIFFGTLNYGLRMNLAILDWVWFFWLHLIKFVACSCKPTME